MIDDFPGGDNALKVYVKVVDVEEDNATTIEWYGTFEIDRSSAARRGQLALFITAGGDLFETLDRAWLAVDTQLEIFRSQVVYKFSLLVEHHHVSLDQLGIDAYDVVFWR